MALVDIRQSPHTKNDDKNKKYSAGNCIGSYRFSHLCKCSAEGIIGMTNPDELQQKNRKLVRNLVLVTIAMFGFGYALVPLYDVLCDITGLNGKTNEQAVAEKQYQIDKSREMTIEFVTSLNKSTPMIFYSVMPKLKIHPGQYYTVNFIAENKTDKTLVAQAIPSVSPGLAAEYLKKTECFCFSQQTFAPHEKKTMPVRFVIDPKLPERYKTITLAYTFFDNTDRNQ